MKINVVITAGGTSERFGQKDKLFERCGSSIVVVEAMKPFLCFKEVTRVAVGCESSRKERLAAALKQFGIDESKVVIYDGGRSRAETVKNALPHLQADADLIAVHDGARPFVTKELVQKVFNAALGADAALPLLKLTDSIVLLDGVTPCDREKFRRVQTPFVAKADILKKAYENAETALYDDISAIKTLDNVKIAYVDGDERNVKITYPTDIGAHLFGAGYDIHRMRDGDGFKLCGVKIHCDKSFVAHSDGDVPVHAIMDAILTALGEKDIGHLYPVDDSRYDGADSLELLKGVLDIAALRGYRPSNATVAIIAEQPRLSPFVDDMRSSLARALGVAEERVGVSATTNEGVGVLGAPYAAIAAFASVLLERFA